ncbi:hypothetical protein BSNK01_23820 [Bacillaceae bacterium]
MFKIKTPMLLLLLLYMVMSGQEARAADHSQPGAKVSVSREEMLDIAKELHPPGCTMTMTADYCLLPPAYDLRAEIWDMLAQGKKKEQIIEELVQKYGERILASPKAEGFSWLAWTLPGAGMAAGAVTIGFLVRAWVRRSSVKRFTQETEETVSAEDKQRVEEELKRWL